MSDYSKGTNFTAKDNLTTGDPDKVVAGAEFDSEFTAIETAIATKANTASPTFTGTVTLPSTLELDSADNAYQYVFSPGTLTADRTVSLPVLTGSDTFVFNDFAATLTNKSISLTNNTLTGTAAEFDTACSDDTFLFTSDLIDDDTFATASATNIASAESVKAYVDANAGGGGDALTSNGLDQFAATTSLELKGVISDETGSGSLVFATSPTLVTPALGTPASGVLTNCTGTASGLTAGTVTTNADLTGEVTSSGNAASVDKTAVTGKSAVTALGTDYVLISDSSDSGNLKKALISDFASAGGDMAASTYDPAGIAEQLVGLTASQTLTSKTLTTPTITQPALTLTQSTNPTPTAEGVIEWDTDANQIVVGDGTTQHRFIAAEDISGDITMNDSGVVTLTSNIITNDDIDGSAAIAATKIHNGTVSNTEFGYLANVTSDIQTQFNAKQDSISGDSLSGATVATNDKVLVQDTSDSDNLKTVTAQSIADLNPQDWVHLNTQTASADSSIIFTDSEMTGCTHYKLILSAVVPSADATPYLRTSTDTGASPTFDTTSYDSSPGNITTAIEITDASVDASSAEGLNMEITIFAPNTATPTVVTTNSMYQRGGGAPPATVTQNQTAGFRDVAEAVKAISFLFSTGTITSGTFHLFGLKT